MPSWAALTVGYLRGRGAPGRPVAASDGASLAPIPSRPGASFRAIGRLPANRDQKLTRRFRGDLEAGRTTRLCTACRRAVDGLSTAIVAPRDTPWRGNPPPIL